MVSEQLVRLKLAQEVEEEAQGYDASVEGSLGDDRPSVAILNGLWLEDDQYVHPLLLQFADIDLHSLDADWPRTSRSWGSIQHPSKSPRWSSVRTTYAVASQIRLNFKSGACLKSVLVDSETQRQSQTGLHPLHESPRHPTLSSLFLQVSNAPAAARAVDVPFM